MPDRPARFDAASVRASWDFAAEAYAKGQASGNDYYRYAFFGPIQVEMCGDVAGIRVLDVGCGNGYFSREMARRGARVTAIDISPNMIEHARRIEAAEPLGIEYVLLDAAEIAARFPATAFDMVTSCISIQDMPEVQAVLRGIRAVLPPGGRLIASITHPCTDTPVRSWEIDEAGAKLTLRIDRYFDEGPIEFTWKRNWPYAFTTAYWHVPLERWFQWILEAGFELRGLREPSPSSEAIAVHPDLADAARVPYFLIFDLVRV
jgi:ubiquinone/menaquinone biosynthesis C-methylase UbiE